MNHTQPAQVAERPRDPEQMWIALCNAQGWNADSQIVHLEGFLADRGLMGEFVAYAPRCPRGEPGMSTYHIRLNDFAPDSDTTAHFQVRDYDADTPSLALLVTIEFKDERTQIRSTALEDMTHQVLSSLIGECSKLLSDLFDPEGHSGPERLVTV